MELKLNLKIALLVGLAGLSWTLGAYVGQIIQYALTQWAVGPLFRLLGQ